jgi:hypothetical protein
MQDKRIGALLARVVVHPKLSAISPPQGSGGGKWGEDQALADAAEAKRMIVEGIGRAKAQ